MSPYSIANVRLQTLNNNLWVWFLVGRLTNIESIAVPGTAAVGLMDGLKRQRRWQVKFILLQQQLFQDEYSAVLRAPAARTLQAKRWQLAKRTSVQRALEKQANQQKAKKCKVHTTSVEIGRKWECGRHNCKNKIAKYLNRPFPYKQNMRGIQSFVCWPGLGC